MHGEYNVKNLNRVHGDFLNLISLLQRYASAIIYDEPQEVLIKLLNRVQTYNVTCLNKMDTNL
jgi:hypothetical protein